MSTNFVYGSSNPLFQEPKKVTPAPRSKPTPKPTETKAQIDARIAANTKKIAEELKVVSVSF